MATVQQANKAANRYERFVREEISRAVRRVRFLDLAKAGLGLLIAVMAYGLVMMFADKWLVLSQSARQVMLVGFLGFVGLYTWFVLLRPVRRAINPYYAAVQVEQMLPDAKNSLVNWLDLHEGNLPPGASAAIGQRAAADLEGADLEQAIRSNSLLWLAGVALGLVIGVVGAFVVMRSDQFSSLLDRTFSPFSNRAIVKQTRITINRPSNGDETLSVGNIKLTIVVQVEGRIPKDNQPDSIRLLMRYSEDGPDEPVKLLSRDPNDPDLFSITLGNDSVKNGFWYRVAGGDDETPMYHVGVRSSPMIERVEVTRVYRPYLGFEPRHTFDANIEDWRGTEITLDVYANRDIRSGNLSDLQDKNGKLYEMTSTPVPGHPEAMRFKFVLEHDCMYRISFVSLSTTNESNSDVQPYRIKALQDMTPVVRFTKPEQIAEQEIEVAKTAKPDQPAQTEPEGDLMIAADGMLHLEGIATDDFGIHKMTLRLKLEGDELKPQSYLSEKAFQLDTGGWMRTINYKDDVDLTKLQRTSGIAVQPQTGQRLEFWLEAEDTCDYPGPQVGSTRHHFAKMLSRKLNENLSPDDKKSTKDEHDKERDNAKAEQKERDSKHEKERQKQGEEDKKAHEDQRKEAEKSGKQDSAKKNDGQQGEKKQDGANEGQDKQPKPGNSGQDDQPKAGAEQQNDPQKTQSGEKPQQKAGGQDTQSNSEKLNGDQQPKGGEKETKSNPGKPGDEPQRKEPSEQQKNEQKRQDEIKQKLEKAANDVANETKPPNGSPNQPTEPDKQPMGPMNPQQPQPNDKQPDQGSNPKQPSQAEPSKQPNGGATGKQPDSQPNQSPKPGEEGSKPGNGAKDKDQSPKPPEKGTGDSKSDDKSKQTPDSKNNPMTGGGEGSTPDPKAKPDKPGTAPGDPKIQKQNGQQPDSPNNSATTPKDSKTGTGGKSENNKDESPKDPNSKSSSPKKQPSAGSGEGQKNNSSPESGNGKPPESDKSKPAAGAQPNPMGPGKPEGNQNQGNEGTPKDSPPSDKNSADKTNPMGQGNGPKGTPDDKSKTGESSKEEHGNADSGKEEIAKNVEKMKSGNAKEREEGKKALDEMAKNDPDPKKQEAAKEALKKAEKSANGNTGSPDDKGKQPKPGESPMNPQSAGNPPKPGDPTQPGKENPGKSSTEQGKPEAKKEGSEKSPGDSKSPSKTPDSKDNGKTPAKGNEPGKSPSQGKSEEAKNESEKTGNDPSKPKPADGGKSGESGASKPMSEQPAKPKDSSNESPMSGNTQDGLPMKGNPMGGEGRKPGDATKKSDSPPKNPTESETPPPSNKESRDPVPGGKSSDNPSLRGGATPPDRGNYTDPNEADKKRSGDLGLDKVDREKLKKQFLKNGGTNEEWDQYWKEAAKQQVAPPKTPGNKDLEAGSRTDRSFLNDGVHKVESKPDANPGQLQAGSTGNAPAEYKDAAAKFAELLSKPPAPKQK